MAREATDHRIPIGVFATPDLKPDGSIVWKVASAVYPKQYEVEELADGQLKCSCRAGQAGTDNCWHLIAARAAITASDRQYKRLQERRRLEKKGLAPV